MDKFFGKSSTENAKTHYLSQDQISGAELEGMDNFVLGAYNTRHLFDDPRRFGFMLARHKFVAKMFTGFDRVLEIGCQEGLGSIVVSQEVKQLVASDYYRSHIESATKSLQHRLSNVQFKGHDIIDSPLKEDFDGAFSMDVLEHIDPAQEHSYMKNIADSLNSKGCFIVGSPSLESQAYASPASRAGHINCKSGEDLHALCKEYYDNVFMFAMNDEVLHTGFLPMAHYLIALCAGPKR
jgi:2-polyprenyl-3-methyl-5-hydroxy-6-metoxy-1,4-benzoquinol methylase